MDTANTESTTRVGALVEGAPSADSFDDVLRVFTTSVSAFEAYHALRALDLMAPVLSAVQSSQARTALLHEQGDPRGVGLMQDAWIPKLMSQVLSTLTLNTTS